MTNKKATSQKIHRSISLRRAIIFAVLITLLSGNIGYNIATSHYRKTPEVSVASEESMLDYINQVRIERGLTLLREDPVLDQTAKLKAEDMAARNYREHTSPDGKPFYFIMQQQRPGLKYYGENLAECYASNPATIEAWVKSPGHLENIIKPTYTIFGSYSVWDSDQACMITVNHFGAE